MYDKIHEFTDRSDAMFTYDNIIFRVLSKIADIVCLNLIFLVSCIPIITIGTAWSALYYTTQKVIRREEGYLWKEYWSFFKENFRQGIILWLIALTGCAILLGDIAIIRNITDTGEIAGFVNAFFVFVFIFVILWINYIFVYLAKFHDTNKKILKNTLILEISKLPKTLLLAVVWLICGLVVYLNPMFILLIPTICSFLVGCIMESIYNKFI